jgi:hypothetical protein
MSKKLWIGFVVIFVVISLYQVIVNMYLMSAAYQATASLWRPMAEMKFWIFYVCYLFIAFFMTLIFSKWYTGKGIMEGLQFGVYTGLMISVPSAYGMYGSMNLPYYFALQWFLYGLIEYVICGIVLSLIFGNKQAA